VLDYPNQDIGYTMPTGAQMKKPWAYVLTSGRILKDTEDDIQDIFSDTDTYIGEMGVKSAIGNKVVQLSNESGQFDSYHFAWQWLMKQEMGAMLTNLILAKSLKDNLTYLTLNY
jgi:hypothetical protein